MADPDEPHAQGGELELSPAEERLLRRFFRRHALRAIAATGVASAALVTGILSVVGRPPVEPPATPAAPPAARVEHKAAAARGELRSDLQALREEVRALGALRAQVDALRETIETRSVAREELRALDQRLGAAIERIERRTLQAAAPAAAGEEVPDERIRAILDRLYNLEARQSAEDDSRARFEKSALERLYNLEQSRHDATARNAAIQQDVLSRLDSLEQRSFNLERTLTELSAGTSAAAAPAP